jgi:hypothetical protein
MVTVLASIKGRIAAAVLQQRKVITLFDKTALVEG